ncbi:ATP-binding protein [Rhodoferax sp.]|uniref:ATP-binding protein n=1 Tax=Rhodoferax sp. TaxID=50421 RepID=UPI0027452E91|nr:ATP-binding protein [Rhodoferax sp.]
MKRYLDDRVRQDLTKKMVLLTGPRQVGKTTLSQQLLGEQPGGQYLSFDVVAHRSVIQSQSWRQSAPLLVFDEIHKMRDWKAWLKGVVDGRAPGQSLLVTGSARMDTFRQTGESLAGRYFRLRLHPLSVREWCDGTGATPHAALTHLLARGGFPEPALATSDTDAQRWRADYFSGLVREDVLEFSRLHEVNAMRLFAQMLRSRVGSPLSLASMARDLQLAPSTLGKYLDILEALFIVFIVRPWHRNIARATLQSPKVYFFDTGLVIGDEGIRFENLVACHLLKQAQWQQDTRGAAVDLHYIRTKDEAEVDFALSEGDTLTHLVECKLSDTKPHRALARFAEQWPQAQAVQLVRECKAESDVGRLQIRDAAPWLASLET